MTSPNTSPRSRSALFSPKGAQPGDWGALWALYLIWGSTFAGLEVALESFPPLILGAIRLSLAGLLLMLIAYSKGARLLPTRPELLGLTKLGLVYWVCSQSMVILAVALAPSGVVGVTLALTPLFARLIGIWRGTERFSAAFLVSAFVGIVGVALLGWPSFREASSSNGSLTSLMGIGCGALSALAWAAGSNLDQVTSFPRASSAAWQLCIGGLGFALLSLALSSPVGSVSVKAGLGLLYLVVVGSAVAFTCYVRAMNTLPRQAVLSFTYINPFVALVLGFLFFDESLGWETLAGGFAVMLAAYLTVSESAISFGRRIRIRRTV